MAFIIVMADLHAEKGTGDMSPCSMSQTPVESAKPSFHETFRAGVAFCLHSLVLNRDAIQTVSTYCFTAKRTHLIRRRLLAWKQASGEGSPR